MDKQKLLAAVATGLANGVITKDDLLATTQAQTTRHRPQSAPTSRLSAVDIMFYIAAIVLFAAIVALIGQSWDSGFGVRVFLSAGLGTIFWAIALYLMRLAKGNDIKSGITNALLLTGSLSLITGGFIIASEYADFNEVSYYATAITLLLVGSLHSIFGSQVRRDLLVLIGVILGVAAFPTLVFGLLDGVDVPMYVNSLIVAISGGLLVYATRVVSWIGASSKGAAKVFDSLGAFIALMSLYVASYEDGTGLLWLTVLIMGIIGLFYLSIIKQDKLMLGNGSFFLVIAIITISFRYFSDYGVAASLFVGAVGLIATAIVATTINRRYIK